MLERAQGGWLVALSVAVAGCSQLPAPPELASLSPPSGRIGSPVALTVAGRFPLRVLADLGGPGRSEIDASYRARLGDWELAGVRASSTAVLVGEAPFNLLPGVYDLVVTDPFGRESVLPRAYEALSPPSALAFTSPPQAVAAGACSSPLAFEVRDAAGARTVLDVVLTVSFAAAPPAGLGFFADPACAVPISDLRLAAGRSSGQLHFSGQAPGPVALWAVAPGLSPATQIATIVGSGPVYRTGSFTKSTGAAPAAQLVTHDLGAAPRALILWTVGKTDQALSPDYLFGLGVSDGPGSSWSSAAASQDGVSRANCSRGMARKALNIVRWAEVPLVEGELSAWNATDFTINWTRNDAEPYVIHYLLIGGPGVRARAVNWQMPPAPTVRAVTGVGFQPDVVLHFWLGDWYVSAPPALLTNAFPGMGVMARGGGQWAWEAGAIDDDAPTQTGRGQPTNAAVYLATLPLAVAKQASFVSMDPDGFSLDFTIADGWAPQTISLALAGVAAKAGSFQKVTGAAPAGQSITGAGFRPGLVLLSSVFETLGPAAHSRMGLGASDGRSAGAIAWTDTSALAESDVKAIDKTSKLFMKMDNVTETIDAEADLLSFDADGFTLRWTTNDAVATETLYLELGAP